MPVLGAEEVLQREYLREHLSVFYNGNFLEHNSPLHNQSHNGMEFDLDFGKNILKSTQTFSWEGPPRNWIFPL